MKLNNNDDSHNSGLNLLIYNMLLDIESHPTWVCGLKHPCLYKPLPLPQSHPTWVCGLKLFMSISTLSTNTRSHPTWVCGLKLLDKEKDKPDSKVTPYVGVWIETLITCFTSASIKSHPAWEYMDWSIVHSSVKFMEEL